MIKTKKSKLKRRCRVEWELSQWARLVESLEGSQDVCDISLVRIYMVFDKKKKNVNSFHWIWDFPDSETQTEC